MPLNKVLNREATINTLIEKKDFPLKDAFIGEVETTNNKLNQNSRLNKILKSICSSVYKIKKITSAAEGMDKLTDVYNENSGN